MRSRNTPGSDFLLCLGDKRPNLSGVSLRLLRVWIRAESAGNTRKQKCAEAAWVTGTETDLGVQERSHARSAASADA